VQDRVPATRLARSDPAPVDDRLRDPRRTASREVIRAGCPGDQNVWRHAGRHTNWLPRRPERM